MKVSKEQIQTMDKHMRRPDPAHVREEFLTQLMGEFPELPKDEVLSFIDAGLEKTARYGIEEETAVRDFIRLTIGVARDFDLYPAAQEQLRRSDASPDLRVQLMCELLTPEEWQQASKSGARASDRRENDRVQSFIYNVLSSAGV